MYVLCDTGVLCHVWQSGVGFTKGMTVAAISWLLKIIGLFGKTYKRDDILQKRPIIFRSLLIVAHPIVTWMYNTRIFCVTRNIHLLCTEHTCIAQNILVVYGRDRQVTCRCKTRKETSNSKGDIIFEKRHHVRKETSYTSDLSIPHSRKWFVSVLVTKRSHVYDSFH